MSLNAANGNLIIAQRDDNGVTDGKTYRTDYSYYDGTKRVKTITQTDGTSVEFEYDPNNRINLIR